MKLFGLIGYPLEHSASPDLFRKMTERENLRDAEYRLFPIKEITELPRLVAENPDLSGFNVTSPYKQAILPYLTSTDDAAVTIDAVNTVKVVRKNGRTELHGYNTDYIGVAESMLDTLPYLPQRALVLGTGGASEAVSYALSLLLISAETVSRTSGKGTFTYKELTKNVIHENLLVVNATPLGMYPAIAGCPDFPFELLTPNHILFDLIYNPEETEFLRQGRLHGAKTYNGLDILRHQAEASYKIWGL